MQTGCIMSWRRNQEEEIQKMSLGAVLRSEVAVVPTGRGNGGKKGQKSCRWGRPGATGAAWKWMCLGLCWRWGPPHSGLASAAHLTHVSWFSLWSVEKSGWPSPCFSLVHMWPRTSDGQRQQPGRGVTADRMFLSQSFQGSFLTCPTFLMWQRLQSPRSGSASRRPTIEPAPLNLSTVT